MFATFPLATPGQIRDERNGRACDSCRRLRIRVLQRINPVSRASRAYPDLNIVSERVVGYQLPSATCTVLRSMPTC